MALYCGFGGNSPLENISIRSAAASSVALEQSWLVQTSTAKPFFGATGTWEKLSRFEPLCARKLPPAHVPVVTQSLLIARWGRAGLGTLLLALVALCASAASPKQVLLLHSFGREFAPFNTFSETFRTQLAQELGDPVELHDVALESARVEKETSEGPLVDDLSALSSPRQPAFWELYRWPITGAVFFCLLQAALIIGLLINRAKRRQGEAVATLTADLSSKFINLPAGEVDHEIEDAQRRVCECLGLDLSALWQWTEETPRDLRLTHLYRPLGGPPTPEKFDSRETFPWCVGQLLDGKIVPVTSMESLPPEAARDKELWHHYGIKSNLTFPLSTGGGQIVGALGFNTTREERAWPEEVVKRLQVVAQIFANALARKRADRALRESEERFRLLIEQAPEAIVVLDLEQNRLVEANAQAERLFGCSRQELLVAGPQRFYTPEQPDGQVIAESMRAYSERALRGETMRFERTICNALGQRLHCEVRLVRLPAGELKRVRASFVDITEVKRSEAALREAQTTLNAIIDSTDDLIWSVDPNSFGLMTFNRGLRDYFLQGRGIRIEPGMGPEVLFPPGEYVQRWRDFYQRALQEGPFTTEYLTYTHTRTLLLSFNVLKRDGNVFGVSVFGKDITERKQAEAELLRQRAELAHVARVSTMGELAASVAHELNQPLGAILANAEAAELFLQQDPPALDDLRAILADIRKDDERAGEVIRRMRALLRKHELERQPLEINSLVEDVLQLVSGDAALRGISLTADLGPVLPKISGDRVHLQQVLLNLILNGMDAMADQPRERRRISVRTRSGADGQVELAVMDSGHGIEPDKLPRLFEPFYTTKPNGMGMGLSIARTIIEAHRGRIWAENNASGGAAFRVTLPGGGRRSALITDDRPLELPARPHHLRRGR